MKTVGSSVENSDGDEIVGYVQDKNGDKYTITSADGSRSFIAEIPSPLHYSVGDSVLRRHLFVDICVECGKEKFYDNKNEEHYCPLGHD